MYTLSTPNSLGDVVDSMPFKSGWASGQRPRAFLPRTGCGCDEGLAGTGASVGVNVTDGGASVNTGLSWPWLIGGGVVAYLLFFKKPGRG